MVVFDTPIHANDQNWQKVLNQELPLVVYLFNRPDPQVDEALKRTAHEHKGQLLVVRVDAHQNAQIYARYDRPALPALLTLKSGVLQSKADPVEQGDIAEHAAYILGKGPKPTKQSVPHSAGKPLTVTDASFQNDVLQSNVPVLVDFWAPWCGPCHMIAPVIEQMATKYSGRIKVAKLNVDENQRTASQYQTMSIPTLIIFKRGQIAGRLVGAHPQPAIERLIESALQN